MFERIADVYDRNNAILSFGLFKRWNRALVRAIRPYAKTHLLDLCAGTGAITYELLKNVQPKVTLLDICPEMLDVARKRGNGRVNLRFIEADAQEIPLADGAVDSVTTAYGIRNVPDPVRCAREVHRVLQPGGAWGILELTRPRNWFLRMGHAFHLRFILPILGRLFSTDVEAYRYLSRSIQKFVSPEDLAQDLATVGFAKVETRPLWGGIATLMIATK